MKRECDNECERTAGLRKVRYRSRFTEKGKWRKEWLCPTCRKLYREQDQVLQFV